MVDVCAMGKRKTTSWDNRNVVTIQPNTTDSFDVTKRIRSTGGDPYQILIAATNSYWSFKMLYTEIFDCHVHSTFSADGESTLQEMCEAAIRVGVS